MISKAESSITDLLETIYTYDTNDYKYSGKQFKLKNLHLSISELAALTNIKHENYSEIMEVYSDVCQKISTYPKNHVFPFATKKEWDIVCADVRSAHKSSDGMALFEEKFVPFLVHNDGSMNGIFTGYYCPILKGSKNRTEKYQYPIYRKPPDLTNKIPYYSRKEIDDGALDDKNLELLWVADKVDLYILHIQGSGFVAMEDGNLVHVGFDGKNGRPYSSIGEYLLRHKLISPRDVSRMGDWLKANRKVAYDAFQINESYIFFKEIDNTEFIYGAHGSKLHPERSIAVDAQYIPLGLPLFVQIPDANLFKIMFSQDTGQAIKGPIRGDVFFGTGNVAKGKAEKIKYFGSYYILLHKEFLKYLEEYSDS